MINTTQIRLTSGWFDYFGIEIDPYTQKPNEFYSAKIAGNKYHSLYKGCDPQCLMADNKNTHIQKIEYVRDLQKLLND